MALSHETLKMDGRGRTAGTTWLTVLKDAVDLGLKRASPDDGARNPPGPPKTYSVQCYTRKAEGFSHHPRISADRQISANDYARSRSRSTYDARPSLSAAAVAAGPE
jgi:hypothetical protein